MTRRRILSIWWPKLAIERWVRTSDCAPDRPVVLTIEGTHGPIIHAVTAAAERGACVGARLTDARAIDPALVAIAADPQGDEAFVRRLARWSQRWSPLVQVDGEDALRLDVSGVAHLFGGEEGLVADVRARFAAMGLTARTAIAPTASAAWALARFSIPSPLSGGGSTRAKRERGEGKNEGTPPLPSAASRLPPSPAEGGGKDLAALLAHLPVAALRLSPQATRTLERLGLKTLEALSGIERRSLARRFRDADNPVDALDRMLGRKPEPLTGTPVEPPPRSTLRLAEPVADPAILGQALGRLADPLVRELAERRLGARRLAFHAFRVDGEIGQVEAETALATRDSAHIVRLLGDKVQGLDPGFGFDAFALVALRCEPLGSEQDALLGEPPSELELARLVDRLVARLGTARVRRPERHESHLPERASGWEEATSSSLSRSDGEGDRSTKSSGGGVWPRPLHHATSRHGPAPQPRIESGAGEELRSPHRLLDSPEAIAVIYATPEGVPRRFIWRRALHDIARVEGPERIAPEWWRERSTARLRDYYRVEDRSGRRFWIYREGVISDGRGGLPDWYIHGLFG